MPQHYNHGLVLVSLLVAILASYTALTLALHMRVAAQRLAAVWLLGGGCAMGIGIWCMHFVGMLALTLPIGIAYDLWITLASMLVAIVVSTFALHIASRPRVRRLPRVAAGMAMGIGICAMHYVGMAAIDISPPIRYDPFWVTASFAIAIAASFAALGVAFTSREDGWWRHRAAIGAVVMGFAITGMHYAGMAAAQFPADGTTGSYAFVDKSWLAGAVTTITLFVLMATLLVSFIEARAAARAARMQASLAEAKETSRAKDEFLAMLGHELRNPLAAIVNAARLLESAAPGSGDAQLAHGVIGRQAAHLASIVEDLLDVGRAITGKMALNPQPIDLHQAVDETLSALRAAGRTVGRHLDYHGGSAWVNADRTRMEQVVGNLVSNAVQHTEESGRIGVRVEESGDEVVLTVTDDGVGMDAETTARAFELFFQAQQDTERRRGGLGIGLTLARRIVDMHGGTIHAASGGPGKGAVFTVRLPAMARPQAARSAQGRWTARPRRNVVIVEDLQDTRLSLQRVLENEGHIVHTASDGQTGLDAILRLRPDVALVDVGLPGLDGYHLAKRLRTAGRGTYLVALTGYGTAEDKSRAREAGFDVHLTKPPSLPDLLRVVSEAGAIS